MRGVTPGTSGNSPREGLLRFDDHLRHISTALFGGTALYVNDGLISVLDNDLAPAFYMIVASIIGLISLRFVVETAGCSLRGTEIPGTPESEAQIAEMATRSS